MKKSQTRRVVKGSRVTTASVKSHVEVVSSDQSSSKTTVSIGRRVVTWLGWGIVYVFVFYLGNLSGEYVAAHLPILPSLPRVSIDTNKFKKLVPKITLPKVSVAWKWPVKTSAPMQVASHTTMVVVRGNFINVPTAEATEAERNSFVQAIQALTVESSEITITDSCEVNPSFIRAKKGATITVASTSSKDHTLMLEGKSMTVASKQKTTVSFTQAEGAYPISCDGVVAGFYRVN